MPYSYTPIEIVKDKVDDSKPVITVKKMIREATSYRPEDRPSADRICISMLQMVGRKNSIAYSKRKLRCIHKCSKQIPVGRTEI